MLKWLPKLKVLLVIVVILSIVKLIVGYAGRLSGTVVDAETGKPIEGAVVLVEWTKTRGFFTVTSSYAVREKVTDKDGKFSVFTVLYPFVNEPEVTIYKKGYVAWNSEKIFPSRERRSDFRWKTGVEFRMEQFKNTYSYIEHNGFIMSSINSTIGWENKKKFLKRYYDSEELYVIQERSELDRRKQGGVKQ